MEILEGGKKKRKEILDDMEKLGYKVTTVERALKDLVATEDIVKPNNGVYALPDWAQNDDPPIPSSDDFLGV